MDRRYCRIKKSEGKKEYKEARDSLFQSIKEQQQKSNGERYARNYKEIPGVRDISLDTDRSCHARNCPETIPGR